MAVFPLFAALWASEVRAELPGNGERLRSNDYAIDLAQTPVLASTRVTGLAGAFVAIGEGTDGSAQNPAGVALRAPYSNDHFDYDVSVGVTFSSALTRIDVFNSGHPTRLASTGEESLAFVNLAGNLQLGRFGLGLSIDLQEYGLNRATAPASTEQKDRLSARFAVAHGMVGYGFHDNDVLLGVGARLGLLDVVNRSTQASSNESLFNAGGAGLEAGLLLKPNETQYRVGVCIRTPVVASASSDSRLRIAYAGDPEDELYLPDRVILPWELHLGLALQFGPRPFNPRWVDASEELGPIRRYLAWRKRERTRRRTEEEQKPAGDTQARAAQLAALDTELHTEDVLDRAYLERSERALNELLAQRYERLRRFHLLVTTSLDVLGPASNAAGVESFLARTVQRSGTQPSFSPRFAVESEAIPGWVRLRGGFYVEPTRFADNPKGSRVHVTLGADQRLVPWQVFGVLSDPSVWQIRGFIDASRQYFSWGLAIGMWH